MASHYVYRPFAKCYTMKNTIFREKAHQLSLFLCGSTIQVKLEFRDVGFPGKSDNPEKKPPKQGDNQNKFNAHIAPGQIKP